jgi:hypothetical protein
MMRMWTRIDGRARLAALAVVLVVGLPVAWYLGSPLFLNMVVDEALPGAPAAALTAGGAPVALSRGEFGEIDAIHKGSGTASVVRLADGARVLRLEDFQVTNGPDLYVYLSGHAAPRSGAHLHEGAAVNLGRLKGNIGSQNYELPADLDLATIKSVVIYCQAFSVVFSTAALMPPA